MKDTEEISPLAKDAATEKRCKKCHIFKPIHEFYFDKNRKRVFSNCKKCSNEYSTQYKKDNPEKTAGFMKNWKTKRAKEVKEYNKNWKDENAVHTVAYSARNRDRDKDRALQRSYGISLNDYFDLIEFQGDKCAICGTSERRSAGGSWMVDHDHSTGKARGLLCGRCNRSIGSLGDNADSLQRAVDYLRNPTVDQMFQQREVNELENLFNEEVFA